MVAIGLVSVIATLIRVLSGDDPFVDAYGGSTDALVSGSLYGFLILAIAGLPGLALWWAALLAAARVGAAHLRRVAVLAVPLLIAPYLYSFREQISEEPAALIGVGALAVLYAGLAQLPRDSRLGPKRYAEPSGATGVLVAWVLLKWLGYGVAVFLMTVLVGLLISSLLLGDIGVD